MGADLKLAALRRDSNEFPVDIALSQLEDENGPVAVGAVRDMTPYRRAESDHGRAERLLAIVEYFEDAIIDTTAEGTLTSWNPAAAQIFGYSGAEILGRSDNLLALEDRTDEVASGRGCWPGRQVDHFESTRTRKGGKVLTVSLSVSPISDDEGAVVGISTVARDLSEAKEAFEAARSMMEASLDSLGGDQPRGQDHRRQRCHRQAHRSAPREPRRNRFLSVFHRSREG